MVSLFLLTACAGNQNTRTPSTDTTPAIRMVQVTITDQKIEASVTTFMVDTAYQFTVVNKAKKASNLVILEHSLVPEGSPSSQQGILYLLPSTQLPPGATQHFTYAFPNTTYQSNLELATDLPGINSTGRIFPIQTVLGK
ncbi:MAG TPA: hypothetical protein VF458_02225 [Ktedonobacteraceae bacterium]